MTSYRPDNGRDDVPETLLEEAAIWHARMRDAERDDTGLYDSRADFDRWLRADPRHRRAYEETARLWDKLAAPADLLVGDKTVVAANRLQSRSRRISAVPRFAALAASLLVLTIAGLAYQDDIIDRFRSDYLTAVGAQLPVNLADGSRIRLNTDSAIAVDLTAHHRHVRLFRGQARFDVATDANRPFVVETSMGAVSVIGTGFDIRVDSDVAVISLLEGRIALKPASAPAAAPPIALIPGEQVRLSAGGVSSPVRFDRTELTAWLRGQLVFYNTPLSKVVAALNRYRNGRIVVAHGGLDALEISGVFRTDDPDAALAVIADTLPVQVTRLTDYLVLLH